MAFNYKVVSRGMVIKGVKETRQMAVQVNKGTVSTRDVAQELQDLTSLGRGDVKSVLEHLGEVVAKHLVDGRSVRLEGLGTFTPRIKAHARPVGEEYTSAFIKGVNMRFTPDKNIKWRLEGVSLQCQREGTCPAPKGNNGGESSTPSTPPSTGGEGGDGVL